MPKHEEEHIQVGTRDINDDPVRTDIKVQVWSNQNTKEAVCMVSPQDHDSNVWMVNNRDHIEGAVRMKYEVNDVKVYEQVGGDRYRLIAQDGRAQGHNTYTHQEVEDRGDQLVNQEWEKTKDLSQQRFFDRDK